MGAHYEFESVRELGHAIGIEPINRGPITGFPSESGWDIYRGEGFGHQGLTDGWLVTFASAESRPHLNLFSDLPSVEPGAIIAHEIICQCPRSRAPMSEVLFTPSLLHLDAEVIALHRDKVTSWCRSQSNPIAPTPACGCRVISQPLALDPVPLHLRPLPIGVNLRND